MSGSALFVLRRHGALWGLAESAVTRIAQEDAFTVVETGAGELIVDEVLGRAAQVRIAPLGGFASALMNGTVAGLGVHQGSCLLVVDPARPPAALRRAAETCAPDELPGDREGEPTNGTSKR